MVVLTYNRTLRGYIEALIQEEASQFQGVELLVETFARWSWDVLGRPNMVKDADGRTRIATLGRDIPLSTEFLLDEVEYVQGRFMPENLEQYVGCTRIGRGRQPRVEASIRQRIIAEVITPYDQWKKGQGLFDWNDLPIALVRQPLKTKLDVVISDESQDFSANQVRAILAQLAPHHNLTFVLDAAQRIYARGFAWAEAGVVINKPHRLTRNYRNTIQIAKLALPLLEGLTIDDDGSLPNFQSCSREGPVPVLLKGTFSKQMDYALSYLREIDLQNETVVFLHPKGGNWFTHVRQRLRENGYPFVELSRKSDWPAGDENIALCTLSSAKGLEFDHVLILGLSAETMVHGEDLDDDRLEMYRRLLAMAIGRARKSVVLGCKPGEAARLVDFLDEDTYKELSV